MTRYARAKGSKSSNEKVPNEATPWYILKQQLDENSSRQQRHTERNKSAKELLQDNEDVFYCDVGNVNNDWAEFEENTSIRNDNAKTKKIKKKKTTSLDKPDSFNQNETDESNVNSKKISSLKRNLNKGSEIAVDVKVKKHKKNKNLVDKLNDNLQNNSTSKQDNIEQNEANIKYTKVNKKKKGNKHNDHNFLKTSINSSDISQINKIKSNVTVDKQQKTAIDSESNNDNAISWDNKNSKNNANSNVTQKYAKKDINRSNNVKFDVNQFPRKKIKNSQNNNKKPKVRDDKEHKRRKPDTGSTKVMINGMEIEIVKFDGFPVKKDDADRLRELKQKMVMKGIPKKEVDIAMKLERRKAEKALARIRKCVCFHCRKAGHNLSDCPELGSEQAGTGICFKCGSTEHTHFECKVSKPTEFRYATCFICREQGHIAKQCPDNPKGIYPQGGSCKVCGDVTHLKKDCPDLIKEKEENTITVNTIGDGNIESLEGSKKNVHIEEKKKSKKIVKF
ncbi:uncharacterized protein LOC116430932 isoform X2 [Nomia melanderi]